MCIRDRLRCTVSMRHDSVAPNRVAEGNTSSTKQATFNSDYSGRSFTSQCLLYCRHATVDVTATETAEISPVHPCARIEKLSQSVFSIRQKRRGDKHEGRTCPQCEKGNCCRFPTGKDVRQGRSPINLSYCLK